ncbi:MAG: molecular chaperone TorD family protein [Desulfovibrio sp.]|nr:molecular chaperone TorD family protein [Desulfovibrio sp.]
MNELAASTNPSADPKSSGLAEASKPLLEPSPNALDLDSAPRLWALGRRFSLGSLLLGYPTESFGQELVGMRDVVNELLEGVPALDIELDLDDLRSEYVALFDRGAASVYESEYGSHKGLSKGNDLADVMGFYQAFGFALAECHEMPDHIAVELEFYAALLMKESFLTQAGDAEGVEIVRDAEAKFLTRHLGGFVTALASSPAVTQSAWFGPLLLEVARWVDGETRRLGVSAQERTRSEPEGESMECATPGLRVLES